MSFTSANEAMNLFAYSEIMNLLALGDCKRLKQESVLAVCH
jgi:hypothetical protein